MAKNYILEPVELTFEENTDAYLNLDDAVIVYESITEGVIIEFSGTKLKYAGLNVNEEKTFTPDGTMPETEPENWATITYSEGEGDIPTTLNMMYKYEGTYTVSIYTETDDPEPAPSGEDESDSDSNDISQNFSFSDHARNDVDGIADLMDAVLGLSANSEEESSGDEQTSEDTGGDEE